MIMHRKNDKDKIKNWQKQQKEMMNSIAVVTNESMSELRLTLVSLSEKLNQ